MGSPPEGVTTSSRKSQKCSKGAVYVQYGAAWCSKVQYSAVKCSKVAMHTSKGGTKCSTVQ
jgi:hypothetical protein